MNTKLWIIALVVILVIAALITRHYRNKYKKLRSIVFKRRSQTPMMVIQCPHCAEVFEGEQPGYFAHYVERKCPNCEFEWDEETDGHYTVEDGIYSVNDFRRKKESLI